MHPVPRHAETGLALAEAAAGLGDLVLMMREDEVEPTAVDIKAFAQMLRRHGRAFQVPAGPAPAPRAVPAGLTVGRGLPQHEIGRVALIGRNLDPGTGDLL